MDIREYFQKEQKGFYKIITETLTTERRKQLYDAINEWYESELKLLSIANVVVPKGTLCDKNENKLGTCNCCGDINCHDDFCKG